MEDKSFEKSNKVQEKQRFTIFIRAKKEIIYTILHNDFMLEKRYKDDTLFVSFTDEPINAIKFFEGIAKSWPSENIFLEAIGERERSMFSTKNGKLISHNTFFPPYKINEIENERNRIMSEYMGYSNEYLKMNDEEIKRMDSLIECFKEEKTYYFVRYFLMEIMNNELDREEAFIMIENMLNTNCKNDINSFYLNLQVAKVMGGIVNNPYVVKK